MAARKTIVFFLILTLVCVIVVLSGILLGSTVITPEEFFAAVLHRDASMPAYAILCYVRLPRVFGAVLAGSSLAVSGALIQSVMENPMASPNILGVNAGAGFFVLLGAAAFPMSQNYIAVFAFLGALFTSAAILFIASWAGLSKLSLVLTGFTLSSIFTAGMNFIFILYPDAYTGASHFLVGGLSGITMNQLYIPAFCILPCLITAILMGQPLNILSLGKTTATALGLPVNQIRLAAAAIAALLAGAAVSFGGLIGFVGLLTPHCARFFLGQDNRLVMPASILMGAAFVTLCDLLSRMLFAPYELPVGILMSLTGGPFFLRLIIQNRWKQHD